MSVGPHRVPFIPTGCGLLVTGKYYYHVITKTDLDVKSKKGIEGFGWMDDRFILSLLYPIKPRTLESCWCLPTKWDPLSTLSLPVGTLNIIDRLIKVSVGFETWANRLLANFLQIKGTVWLSDDGLLITIHWMCRWWEKLGFTANSPS